MKKAMITGVYDTDVGALPGSSCMGLHAEAALGALADAGLTKADIDGVLCAYSFTEPHLMLSSVFCEYMNIQPKFNAAIEVGGATACVMVMQAAALVEAGICKHVLVVTGDNRMTGMPKGGAVATLAKVGHGQFEHPYGMSVPAAYALVAQNYMHEYGVTSEHLASISVTAREYASMNSKAHMKKPITIDDVLNSRIIASPLHVLDCCLISDGGAAIVVSAADAAKDRPKKAIEIMGTGQGHTHEHIMAAPSLVDFGCKSAAKMAFERAGITAKDVDVAEIYDSFTITLLVELESIGFFERGEAGPACLAGALKLGGKLPCNTHGGLMSYAHSGAAGGMFHVVEAVRQLRREAENRQVEDCEVAFVHGDGGILSAHCSIVLGRN
ncbi:thiolase family protein [Sneathiella sp.]|uniref:thiolase family protein n=1 Tax=Sneathiella sp. TaxID=1964365 RepID=UPI002FE2F48E